MQMFSISIDMVKLSKAMILKKARQEEQRRLQSATEERKGRAETTTGLNGSNGGKKNKPIADQASAMVATSATVTKSRVFCIQRK
jgi:hypothetical protein